MHLLQDKILNTGSGVHVTQDQEKTYKETSANPATCAPPPHLWKESGPAGLTPSRPVPWGTPFFLTDLMPEYTLCATVS